MKISVEKEHPDFWIPKFPDAKHGIEIFLDGSPVEHVYEADDEAGTVKVIKHNGAYPIFAGGRYVTETLTGKVEIRVKTSS